MKLIKDCYSSLDRNQTYRATVHGHQEWGDWVLRWTGATWEATGDRGVVLASAHWWNIG